jgi:hypothetical protein
MKKILLLGIVFVALVLLVFNSGKIPSQANFLQFLPVAEQGRDLLMPDIVPTAPFQLYIQNSGGKKTLRFSTTFYNQGQGALELIGHTDNEKNITYASQYVYEADGPGIYRDIGSFIYHPEHTHWHIDQYVFYQFWSVNQEEKPDKLLLTTDKMSFCIWDENPHDLNLDKAPRGRIYPRSCNGRQQGMSVGWSDTYSANIEGQELDITGIPDGTYVFRTTINPDNKILETDYGNNIVDILVEVRGNQLLRKN